MDVLFYLLPISGVFSVIIVVMLVWAVKSGQFDDMEGPAYRILMDDDEESENKPESSNPDNNKQNTSDSGS